MIFLYCDEAGRERVTLKGEQHKYLVKVRRHKEGERIALRSVEESRILHTYEIVQILPRSLELSLVASQEVEVVSKRKLHIGWCIIDTKSIEKVLASLNEIGVAKITFIYCAKSQRNFKPDLKRFRRILQSSNQQCGRSNFMEFELCDSLEEFVVRHPELKVFDFCETTLKNYDAIETVLIGSEGGFSEAERELLQNCEQFRLDTPLVLRSESAAVAVAAKVLL